MRRRLWLTACLIPVLLTGCGSAETAPSTSTGRAETTHTEGHAMNESQFPLTIVRQGGIAGFDDRIRIDATGTAVVTQADGSEQRCTVDRELMRTLTSLVSGVDWPHRRLPSMSPQHPDDLVVVLHTPQGAAKLTSPAVAALEPSVRRLLNDISRPPEQRQLCTPSR